MFGFLSGLKISKNFLIGLGIAAILGLGIFAIKHLTSELQDSAEIKGQLEVTTDIQTKGIEDVKNANEAVEELKRNPDARLSECLRNSRNPEACASQ